MALPQQPSLSERIAHHLSREIIQGRRQPRERLPESELAAELEVSTNSLREAFRLLQSWHLVVIQPRRGARVSDVSEADVRDLYDFLFLLLGRLASDVAYNWQPGQLEPFLAISREFEVQAEQQERERVHELAFELAREGLKMTTNRYLTDAIEDLLPLLQRYSFMALKEETTELRQSVDCMRETIEAVLERDAARAAQCLKAYGENQSQVVLRALSRRDAA
ncbi:GntR family transcriptional regulator [Halomonadaceae bacterium KBTZ08]